jgi:hypothetical protein
VVRIGLERKIGGRWCMISKIKIRHKELGTRAIEFMGHFLCLNMLIEIAKLLTKYRILLDKFKNLLITRFKFDVLNGELETS